MLSAISVLYHPAAKPGRSFWISGLALVCAAACPLPARAADDTATAFAAAEQPFDIPAGPLGPALTLFGERAGLRLLVASELTDGLQTPGVSGTLAPEQALRQLLTGTGLIWRYTGSRTVTLERRLPDDGAILLGPVRVEGTVPVADEDRAYTTAGSSSHISQQKIERFRGTSVGDIFQGTPGVLISENRNSGGLDVNIRGMQGQSRVPVLIDGSRQETTVYRGYAGVSSRSYVDPDLIAGIDITKGPSVSADGTGAIGGVVNMRTVGANDIIKDDKDWGLRIRGSAFGNSSEPPPPGTVAGMNGTGRTYHINCVPGAQSLCQGVYQLPAQFGSDEGMNRPDTFDLRSWAGSIAAAKRFEWFDLTAAYAQRNQGNYYSGTKGPTPEVELIYPPPLPFFTEVTALRDGIARFRGGERIVNSNNDSNSILLKSSIYLPFDQSWELSYLRYDSEYGELMPSQLIWLDQIKQTENSEVTAPTYTSRYRYNPASDAINVSFNLWHTHTNSLNRAYSEDLIDLYSGDPTPERYDRWGGDLSNKMQFERWGSHTLEYGLTAQWEDMDTEIPSGENGETPHNASYGRIGDRQEYSVFLNWQYKPLQTLTLDAGMRYSRAKTDDHKLVVPTGREECLQYSDDDRQCIEEVYVESVFCVDENGDGACDPIRYRTSNDGTAPVVSLTWEPWLNGLQFYAQYAQAIRMPSLFEATSGWSVMPALDVPLKAERAYNFEIGTNFLKRDAIVEGDRIAAKLAWFRNRTKDYLTRTSPNTWEESGQLFTMRNIESVDLHGVELSMQYDAGIAYAELGGSYYHHIEVCHYGSYRRERCNDYGVANSYFNNMIPPKWHGSATLGARLFSKRLDFGARGTFMGQRTETPPFNDNTAQGFNRVVPWHAYNLIDIYASWKHNDTVTVDFNIDNLTDRYYLDALSLGLVPAPGRTARLSFTVHF